MDGDDSRMSDRTFVRAAWAIIVVAAVAFAWFVSFGTGDLLASRTFSGFFDLQARAMAHGHLSVPDGSLGIEGFVVNGRTYAYFGLFPSALRLPIFAFTDRFDGRLSALSMLVAYVIALRACLDLLRGGRALARPGTSWTPTGAAAALIGLTVVAVGSNLFFLASGAWVYHEASMWGAAGVLASFAAIVVYLRRPGLRPLAAAAAWATVAWLSRGSVGLGPTIALGLIGLDHLLGLGWLRALAPAPPSFRNETAGPLVTETARSGGEANGEVQPPTRSPHERRRWGLGLLAAGAVGAAAFGAFNTAKFGSPTVLPMDKQVGSQHPWPTRERALAAYGGSLFSARLIPATVAQSLRPDVVAPTQVFPYLRFTYAPPLRLGQPVFDTVEPSAGLTVTQPLLLLAGVVGAGVVFRPRRRRAPDGLAALRPLLLGAAAGSAAPFTIAFIAQRYLADVIPLLVVGTVAAVAAIDRRAATRPAPRAQRLAFAAGLVLALGGIAATWSTTWLFQRIEIPPSAAVRAAAIRTQTSVGRHVGRPPAVWHGPVLPPAAEAGRIFVVGRCDGVYFGQPDRVWVPLERGAGVGVHRVAVATERLRPGTSTSLLSTGNGPTALQVGLRVDRAGRGHVVLDRNGSTVGAPFVLPDQGPLVLDVDLDPSRAGVAVATDGRDVFFAFGPAPIDSPVRFGPTVSEQEIPMSLCQVLDPTP